MTTDSLSTIRLIPFSIHSAAFNMAADEYLMSLPGPVLRFYGWEKPTLSFGRLRPNLEEIDTNVCRNRDIQGVRRLSGGKTILHQHELTYTFAADTKQFPASVVDTYRLISQPLAAGFRRLGLNPEMKKTADTTSGTSICFKEVSSYELTVGGKKLVGSAQYRKRDRFMQHGSILLDIDWELWKAIWRVPASSKMLEDRITTVKEHLASVPPIRLLTEALTQEFCHAFQTDMHTREFSGSDLAEIEKRLDRYQWQGF